LIQVARLSGRPHLSYGLQIPTQRVGTYDTQLVEFFVAVVNHSQMTLHIRQVDGINSHHIMRRRSRRLREHALHWLWKSIRVVPVRFPVLRSFVAQAAL